MNDMPESMPPLKPLYSPLIYAAESSLAVQEADAYDRAMGVEYDWGHVRWEATPCRRAILGVSPAECVDWCVVVKRLQQATVGKPHLHAEAQRMLEQFVRAKLGRRPALRLEVPGPLCMLRMRVGTARASVEWSAVTSLFQLIPMWSAFILQCLRDENEGKAHHTAQIAKVSKGEILQESE